MAVNTGCVAALDDVSFEKLQCTGCQATFNTIMDKLQHTCTRKYFDCKICNRDFPDALSLSVHQCISVIGDAVPLQQQPTATKRKSKKKTSGKAYECEVCSCIIVGAKNLTKHARKHPGYKAFKCDMCERAFTQNNHLLEHRKRHLSQHYYPCNKCDRTFQSASLLTQHAGIHTGKHPFKCKKCSKSFMSQSSLYRHNQTHIIGNVPNTYLCDICDETFSNPASLAQHDLTHQTGHDSPAFECTKCDMSFNSKSSLHRHSQTHTGDVPDTYSCDVCDETFSNSSSLAQHNLTHQTGQTSATFKCRVCSMSFMSKSSLYRHSLIHKSIQIKEYSCGICAETFSDAALLTKHELIHQTDGSNVTEQPIQLQLNCVKCGEVFNSHLELKQHACTVIQCTKCKTYVYDLTQHTCVRYKTYRKKAKDQVCKVCGKAYSSFKHFNNHCLLHANYIPYECDLCGHKFIEKKYLTRHERLHEAKKPYVCEICNMKFRYRIALTKHTKTYDEDLPFKCEVCGLRFASKCFQYSHFNQEHNEKKNVRSMEHSSSDLPDGQGMPVTNAGPTELILNAVPSDIAVDTVPPEKSAKLKEHKSELVSVKKFKCKECGSYFSGERPLQRHMDYIHGCKDNYRCYLCDATFSCSTNLNKHIRVHSGLGPLKCNVCNAGFYQWPQLKSHQRIHRGNKMYKCEICSAKFTSSYSFNQHPCQKNNVSSTKGNSEIMSNNNPIQRIADSQGKDVVPITDLSSAVKPGEHLDGIPNTDNPLARQILKLLTMVIDKTLLSQLGWPKVPVELLLQSIVSNCQSPVQVLPTQTNSYIDQLRENCKILLEIAVGKPAIEKLLQMKSVDAVIKILSDS